MTMLAGQQGTRRGRDQAKGPALAERYASVGAQDLVLAIPAGS